MNTTSPFFMPPDKFKKLKTTPWINPVTILLVVSVAAILCLGSTFFEMGRLWLSSSSYHHGLLVVPIVAWLIVTHGPKVSFDGSPLPGILIIIGALSLWWIARLGHIAIVEQAAFVTLLIGIVGLAFGANAIIAWAFPLSLLYFMPPFGEVIVPTLQTITAKFSTNILSAVGISAFLDDTYIRTSVGAFEVAKSCAGLRYILAACLFAATLGYIHIRDWKTRIGYVIGAIMLAIIANILRAATLVGIATLSNLKYAMHGDHAAIGWVFYAALLGALYVAARKLGSSPTTSTTTPSSPDHPIRIHVYRRSALGVGALVIASISVAAIEYRAAATQVPSKISLNVPDQWHQSPEITTWRAYISNTDFRNEIALSFNDKIAFINFGFLANDKVGFELINHENRSADGHFWRVTSYGKVQTSIAGSSRPLSIEFLSGSQGKEIATTTFYAIQNKL